jgi:hypothetical protein
MSEDEEVLARIKTALDRNRAGMEDSSIFTSIWHPKTAEQVLPTIQWGLAVLLDKPVYLIVPPGREHDIPENVRRLARDMLTVSLDDREGAQIAARWIKEKAGV